MFIISFPIGHAHLRYISYTTIGYKYSFVHDKSKEGDLYIVDNVENGIILSPEGPNFEGRQREQLIILYDTVFWTWTIDTLGV